MNVIRGQFLRLKHYRPPVCNLREFENETLILSLIRSNWPCVTLKVLVGSKLHLWNGIFPFLSYCCSLLCPPKSTPRFGRSTKHNVGRNWWKLPPGWLEACIRSVVLILTFVRHIGLYPIPLIDLHFSASTAECLYTFQQCIRELFLSVMYQRGQKNTTLSSSAKRLWIVIF